MAKINTTVNLDQITDPVQFMRYSSQVIQQVIAIVNGNLGLNTNLNGKIVTVTFSAANTPVTVNHNLGGTNVKYMPVSHSAGGVIYSGSAAITNSTISLESTVAQTSDVFFFLKDS